MEARAEHPGARRLKAAPPGQIIGIDLGTTNCALAWSDARGAIRIFDVPQLVAAGELDARATLPSFLYFTDQAERDAAVVRLPWNAAPDVVAGVFARDEGGLVPARQVSSAKSWLSNPHVDRTAPLLPWGTETGPRLSPVDASTRLLTHLRDAWNHGPGSDDARRLERQQLVLTVPASFDEEARELTMRAGQDAGFEHLTLLEEPLAALYSWIAGHRRQLATVFGDGALILVCDVGGGTTDFSLIRARIADDGELAFERIAIGEHLLLGGDNLDLALAALVEQKLGDARLSLTQRQILRRKCSAAKESLLSSSDAAAATITILGAGRGVVAGGRSAQLAREEVTDILTSGFLPTIGAEELPARDRRVGLRELGLPYETEPAITKHLAAFLTRAARQMPGAPMARPDAILFNGGFFTPAIARERLLDAMAGWFGSRPMVLDNEKPDAAVAIGAAFYGRLRRDPAASKRLIIRAGSGRAYYVGVATADVPAGDGATTAVCVMPRGTDEGTRLELAREFTVTTNQPAAFTLYSSADRTDALNAVVAFDAGADDMHRHAPLVTALRYGKRSRRAPLGVRLTAAYTETGTLELWCESRTTDHRWRLAFNLRGEADPLDVLVADDEETDGAGVIVADEAVARAEELIRVVFGAAGAGHPPDALVGELENIIGHGKHAWPLATIRRLADVLLATAEGRAKGAAFEVRWLNLAGFCTRPGFGSSLDAWRVSELRKIYAAGLAFPREIQNQAEWIVLWQRVGAGFTAGQQRELAQRITGQLGLGQRKAPRLNPQIERESWRLLGSLERLDAGQRTRLGDEILERIRREPRNVSWLWTLGRLGARQPLYGPLNSVVPAPVAERWVERLRTLRDFTAEAAATVTQICALTGDPARDTSPESRAAAAEALQQAGFADLAYGLAVIVPADRLDAGRVFGESLPEGLKLA